MCQNTIILSEDNQYSSYQNHMMLFFLNNMLGRLFKALRVHNEVNGELRVIFSYDVSKEELYLEHIVLGHSYELASLLLRDNLAHNLLTLSCSLSDVVKGIIFLIRRNLTKAILE